MVSTVQALCHGVVAGVLRLQVERAQEVATALGKFRQAMVHHELELELGDALERGGIAAALALRAQLAS